MPEYIDREAFVACLRNDPLFDLVDRYGIVSVIEAFPAADVRDVVRCRDCYWWIKQEDSLQGCCRLLSIYPTGAWFCGNGIREEDFLQRVRLRNIPKLGGDPDA